MLNVRVPTFPVFIFKITICRSSHIQLFTEKLNRDSLDCKDGSSYQTHVI
ncbi:hypothetical protein LEP1GSC133_5078 [Leptospira borgpetersenii serovar Pomona str. 200901868]|uniref:Uncharacterized protein n=2 Tax=Leptospira TaxID=171 RepID=A0AA87MTX5_9LEPT|nr:hypothetical protein LEP1GSC125_0762 [Leptospira mayottensis 200901122]EMO60625.1 hypothetical protein LEP1GSC133_5078 [Leptospira borgpetersenii serovar Pomona str. 200901868]